LTDLRPSEPSSKQREKALLGIATLPLIALWLVRMPVMLVHPSQALEISGIPVMPPPGASGALQLVRSDINRYATVLAPLTILGLRDFLARFRLGTINSSLAEPISNCTGSPRSSGS
jgi:hypothetical protein